MSSSLPTACPSGFYGPDCALECTCQNGGSCNRFSGCVCPAGWHGQHCEKSGEIGTGLWQVSIPHPSWVLAPSSSVAGRAIGYWSRQLVPQDPLAAELDCKSVETRTLQGQHLVWIPALSVLRVLLSPACGVGIRAGPQYLSPFPWHHSLAASGSKKRCQAFL